MGHVNPSSSKPESVEETPFPISETKSTYQSLLSPSKIQLSDIIFIDNSTGSIPSPATESNFVLKSSNQSATTIVQNEPPYDHFTLRNAFMEAASEPPEGFEMHKQGLLNVNAPIQQPEPRRHSFFIPIDSASVTLNSSPAESITMSNLPYFQFVNQPLLNNTVDGSITLNDNALVPDSPFSLPSHDQLQLHNMQPMAQLHLSSSVPTVKSSRLSISHMPTRRKSSFISKDLRCTLCNAQFSRPADIERHIRSTHYKDKESFGCTVCDKSYTRQDSLQRHFKSKTHIQSMEMRGL